MSHNQVRGFSQTTEAQAWVMLTPDESTCPSIGEGVSPKVVRIPTNVDPGLINASHYSGGVPSKSGLNPTTKRGPY